MIMETINGPSTSTRRVIKNIKKRCRTCVTWTKKEQLTDIFGTAGVHENLQERFFKCFKIQIHPDDLFPKEVCADCIQKLEKTEKFLDRSRRSRQQWWEIYKNSTKRSRSLNPESRLNSVGIVGDQNIPSLQTCGPSVLGMDSDGNIIKIKEEKEVYRNRNNKTIKDFSHQEGEKLRNLMRSLVEQSKNYSPKALVNSYDLTSDNLEENDISNGGENDKGIQVNLKIELCNP